MGPGEEAVLFGTWPRRFLCSRLLCACSPPTPEPRPGGWGLSGHCFSSLQVADMSECVGSALIQKGFKAAPDQYIGIFAQNRPEVRPRSPDRPTDRLTRLSAALSALRWKSQSAHTCPRWGPDLVAGFLLRMWLWVPP